jgi:hypothetical protein
MDQLENLVPGNKGVSGLWFKGMDEGDRVKFTELLRHSGTQFDRMRTILVELYRGSRTRERDMTNPNWSHLAAKELGYQEALLDIYKILPTTKEQT